MKFNTERVINKIQVPIVRVCNKHCPNCCAREELSWYNKSLDKDKEISIQELEKAGKLFGTLDSIELTGGEPTLHSKFEEITNNLRNLFDSREYMLVSNGYIFEKDISKLPLLLKYNRIWITHYTDKFVENNGGTSNTKIVNIISEYLKNNGVENWTPFVINEHIIFKNPPYGGIPCSHYMSNMITYYENKLYGCCVAWSIKNKGIPISLTKSWREHLTEIDLPCENCFLSS